MVRKKCGSDHEDFEWWVKKNVILQLHRFQSWAYFAWHSWSSDNKKIQNYNHLQERGANEVDIVRGWEVEIEPDQTLRIISWRISLK